ncbi:hypothetical protein ACEWY4_000486 [Coilia grayii]|uniref:Death-inducer obliterator 1 n=1 Tax=Coilia grayii TaxID=363190 RepID=A0ABD1KWU1_9TELE
MSPRHSRSRALLLNHAHPVDKQHGGPISNVAVHIQRVQTIKTGLSSFYNSHDSCETAVSELNMEGGEEGSSRGPTKTWGFRRTTIARREFLEEVGELLQDSKPPPDRRTTRQSRGRGAVAGARRPAESTPTPTRRGRGRGSRSRKSSPDTPPVASVSTGSTATADLQASEVSLEDGERNGSTETHPFSDSTEDSDEMTLKQYAERLKRRKQLEEARASSSSSSMAELETKLKTNGVQREVKENETSTEDEEVAVRQTGKPGAARAFRFPDTEDEEGEADVKESLAGCESEDTDPDAVYCLCRQKHNKRFMICCDRCQEWFHGDCVGISEKRGSLMEKNKEEYVCPNCSPCASPVPSLAVQATLSSTRTSSSSERLASPCPSDGSPSGDYAIKGKIRKSSSQGEKKIKIFHSVLTSAVVKEEQALPKCIGPGCTKSALPDSVYCGHDCILRHAAVAMKSLSGPKPPKPEPPPEAKPTLPKAELPLVAKPEPPPEAKPTPKPFSKPTILSAFKAQMKPLLGKVGRKRPSGQPVDVENRSAAKDGADKEKEASALPSPQTEAVRAEQTSAIAPSVFYKCNKETTQTVVSKTETDDHGRSKPPSEVTANPEQTAPLPENRTMQTDFNLLPLKATHQSASDSDPTASRHPDSGAHTGDKDFPLLPRPSHEQIPSSTSPSSPTASASVLAPKPQQAPVLSPKPKPSIQIRLNVRRSLTDTLWRRVNDSENITLSEKEVGTIALNIEKAIYNMFLSTDSRYKNKYRLIMFNLKDPKNKVLFEQVISGVISPSQLTTLSQDDLQGKVPSSPNICESTQSIPEMGHIKQDLKTEPSPNISESTKSIPEVVHVKQAVKTEPSPCMAAEKTTQLSGVEVSKSECSPSPSVLTQNSRIKKIPPNKPSQQLTKVQPAHSSITVDIISNMLKDTTSEHKAHLFDLKCRICTGQISAEDYDEEHGSKRMKKSEPESKREMIQKERPPNTKQETSQMETPQAKQESSQMQRPQTKQETSQMLRPQTKQETSQMEKPQTKQETSHKERPPQTKQEPSHRERHPMTKQETSEKDRPPKTKPEALQKERLPKTGRVVTKRTAPTMPRIEAPVMESPASPVPEYAQDDGDNASDFTPIVIPEVSIVSITRQDPRTAGYRPVIKPSVCPAVTPSLPTTPITSEPKEVQPPQPPPPPPVVPKSILTKPSGSSVRLYSTSRTPSSMISTQPPPDKDTRNFLLRQETIWKGFLDMPTVAKFVTKGYLVSGTSKFFREDIPDTIHIGGRILPQTVWDYIEKVKTSHTKDLCLIRFQPATDEEEVAYVSLFSYFNSRRRFGVVSDHCRYIKDFYLMPLGAQESIPSLLQPLNGPGFEQNRPNLLLGLAILQKPKPLEALAEQAHETGFKTQTASGSSCDGFPTAATVPTHVKPSDWQPYDPEIPISTTPPGSPDSSSSGSVSSPSDLTNTVLSIIKAPTALSSNPVSESAPTDNTPLKTILNTLFGKKGVAPGNTIDLAEQSSSVDKKPSPTASSKVDLIVQRYGHISKDDIVKESEISKDDDRPYDPEEEYDPGVEYDMLNQPSTVPVITEQEANDERPYDPEEYDPAVGYIRDSPLSPDQTPENKAVVEQPGVEDDVAYDPEDSTFFEEMQADLVGVSGGASGTVAFSDQQRMLLELNKQIEEQKRQLEQQEEALSRQRAAAGMSMAHFSVSDALLSPPRTSYLSRCDLLQLVEKQNTNVNTTSNNDMLIINQRRDPRQKRDTRQAEKPHLDTEHRNKNTPLESPKSEIIPAENSPTMTKKRTSKEESAVCATNEKLCKEKTNTKKTSPEKIDEKVSDKSCVKKSDTHPKAKRFKADTDKQTRKREQCDDAPRHSHHRSRHEHRRTSQRDAQEVSLRKRRSIGDRREVRHTQPHSDGEKRHHRERFERRGRRTSLGKQRTRRQQRWESSRETEPMLDRAQRGDTFPHHRERGEPAPDNQLNEQALCPNTKPRALSPGQFCDYDSSPHSFEMPFPSNQNDPTHRLMHQPGPRGPFGQHPQGPFENTGPRPPRSGPQGPQHRPFDDSPRPRIPRAGSHDSQHNPDEPVPPQIFRSFSNCDAHTEQSEVHHGDLEKGMQRTHFRPPNRFEEQRGGSPAEERRGLDFCRPGQMEGFRGRQMVTNRRASFPNAPDMPMKPRTPMHHFPTSVSPQRQQTFKEQSPPSLDHRSKRDHASGQLVESEDQPSLSLGKLGHQSEPQPRRHTGPLLPTPPSGLIGSFNPTMQQPHQNQENPWPPQNSSRQRGGSFERDNFRSNSAGMAEGHFEQRYPPNQRENEDPLPHLLHEYTGEQAEEGRMSDGGMPSQRDRRPWPRQQGWKRGHLRGRGRGQSIGGDRGESEGETRRAEDRWDPWDAKRARIRNSDGDGYGSGQEGRNQTFHGRQRGRRLMGERFTGFGNRGRGREKHGERS